MKHSAQPMGLDYSQLRPISSQFPFIYNTLYQINFPLCIKQYIMQLLSMKATLQPQSTWPTLSILPQAQEVP